MNELQKNVQTVLARMSAMAAADEDDAEMFASALDEILDEIHGDDGFGTEGQCDPRGDFRNGTWTMRKVEPDRA